MVGGVFTFLSHGDFVLRPLGPLCFYREGNLCGDSAVFFLGLAELVSPPVL